MTKLVPMNGCIDLCYNNIRLLLYRHERKIYICLFYKYQLALKCELPSNCDFSKFSTSTTKDQTSMEAFSREDTHHTPSTGWIRSINMPVRFIEWIRAALKAIVTSNCIKTIFNNKGKIVVWKQIFTYRSNKWRTTRKWSN